MIKISDMWLSLEQIKYALVDRDGDVQLCFGPEQRVSIPAEKEKAKARIIAALDQAAGCTPAAKTEAEVGETLYGVAPDGREVQVKLRHMPNLHENHPLRRVDWLRYSTPKGIIKYLNLTRICPPGKACETLPHEHETYPDCEECWISWLWERDELPDGDPHG